AGGRAAIDDRDLVAGLVEIPRGGDADDAGSEDEDSHVARTPAWCAAPSVRLPERFGPRRPPRGLAPSVGEFGDRALTPTLRGPELGLCPRIHLSPEFGCPCAP